MTDDDTETVYIGSNKTRNPNRYHTDRDCYTLQGKVVEKPRDVLERGTYTLCKVCAGDYNNGGKGENSRKPLRDLVEAGVIEHE